MSSRKRRAPGASPQVQQQAGMPANTFGQGPGNISDQYLNNWNDPSGSNDLNMAFGDPPLYDQLSLATGQPTHSRIVSLDGLNDGSVDDPNTYSNQLVRRNQNQQLAARSQTPWDAFNTDASGQGAQWEQVEEDDDELEQKAIVAKKDAQSKRKQIPPFVQKLSSFLDNNKNETLIRWSDDGNSFIVLDEDEFARTLIPELFKHNNYASFVRQLNMYGFHKKVGLSDNSMKASETKAKAPSEYFNKYFKRGRPELLWLIQKPKNATVGPKRKRDDDGKQGDSDDERKYAPDGGGGGYGDDRVAVRAQGDMALIPRAEYNSLRTEVRTLQQQQKVISNVLQQIRRQNDQLYQQATAFQTLHDRHENSINAILTFLATFYNRSLEGNGAANLAEMFAAPNVQQQSHGNVVDVGDDFQEKAFQAPPQMHRTGRRPLALLPAPAQKDVLNTPTSERATTLTPSVRSTTASPITKPSSRQGVFKSPVTQSRTAPPASTGFDSQGRHDTPTLPLKVDNSGSPQNLGPLPETDEIMSAIQNANSNQHTSQGTQFDFPTALSNFQTQGGNVPLTQQQRNDVLSLMANSTSAASPNSALAQNDNNALANPEPPAMPSLDQFSATQSQIDFLQKHIEQQNERVQNLQERLTPLSPSGSIPGLTGNSYFGNAALGEPGAYDLDLDSFVQGDDYFSSNTNGGSHAGTGPDITLPDLNYELPDTTNDLANAQNYAGNAHHTFDSGVGGFDGAADDAHLDAGGRIESVSSSATSPAATVEDVEDEDSGRKRSPKRRRK
ncbi:hypothetical protein BDV96DRAFT_600179 [Lophiotrema nucula]|uniref:HSF-type DNA-binding domain-containing protein n=1 Tax=Lophiotrema nucula TaxID=690887 RepID=A0A6A5Z9H4_9PLEO|nr:hypothetical protein BDV96DRAFT_600179 [Lophiotrema nucula]